MLLVLQLAHHQHLIMTNHDGTIDWCVWFAVDALTKSMWKFDQVSMSQRITLESKAMYLEILLFVDIVSASDYDKEGKNWCFTGIKAPLLLLAKLATSFLPVTPLFPLLPVLRQQKIPKQPDETTLSSLSSLLASLPFPAPKGLWLCIVASGAAQGRAI